MQRFCSLSSSEDQKIKIKVFTKNGRVFSPNSSEDQKPAPNIIQRSDADQSQIIEGDADVDHSQIIGENIPPSFGIPLSSATY